MTVDEVMQRARTLETTIARLIDEFEDSTGCVVDRVDVPACDYYIGGRIARTGLIRIDVSLRKF